VPFPVPQHRCTAYWSSFDFRKTDVFRNSSVARLNLSKDRDTVGLPLTGRGLNPRVSYVGGEKTKNQTVLLVSFSKNQFLGSGFSWVLGRKERRPLTAIQKEEMKKCC
jgi:hypothetical protein